MTLTIPLPYRLFFLYIEPISAISGCIAALNPSFYLGELTLASSFKPDAVRNTQTDIALYQLANLYLLFALNEHLVLSSTSSLKTWRILLLCLLIADLGHLATMAPLGRDAFWKVWEWNAMLWGSIGFVYLGASMRLSFLLGLGFGGGTKS
ncbi:uncharacterized protein BT62DRAFT_947964 [Guyanagaster necrorhizus]|uniref:DUF7704 domain-containing protein n=1 Tax=Guyanagaster necrorhizus TaxID=856835 RepID=A0A9P8AU09_9AGAR|nr:uncharacterized protein BT62DRAFT_947964 [Guyanagaster necrorhizus MCA 3950]KAG7447785.1 hypothetical protein BT62DRAFT_947964 [Guyanagaster necrorhizus MCA 3950]